MPQSFGNLRGFPGGGPGGASGGSAKDVYTGRGEVVLTVPGTYEITVPEYTTAASFLALGAGGGALLNVPGSTRYYSAGAGGALAYKNDVPVSPGDKIIVVVGAGGVSLVDTAASPPAAGDGGDSYVKDILTCRATGGKGGSRLTIAQGGTVAAGDGGGNGGNGSQLTATGTTAYLSGGAAGGYTGNGGNGVQNETSFTTLAGNPGTGGAGGSGTPGSPSGSVGLYGLGNSGAGGTLGSAQGTAAGAGKGGSGGADGKVMPGASRAAGIVVPGAGASIFFSSTNDYSNGGDGAVRIVFGVGRAFPSTDVGMG